MTRTIRTSRRITLPPEGYDGKIVRSQEIISSLFKNVTFEAHEIVGWLAVRKNILLIGKPQLPAIGEFSHACVTVD